MMEGQAVGYQKLALKRATVLGLRLTDTAHQDL